MTIPVDYGHIVITFGGASLPTGAAITFGVDASTTQDPNVVSNAIIAEWAASGIMSNVGGTVSTETIKVKLGPDATGPFQEEAMVTSGGAAGSVTQPNTAILVHKRSNFGGPKNRGRWFIPGVVDEDVETDGTLDAARRTSMQTAVDAFLNGVQVAGYNPVILHSGLETPTTIVTMAVDGTVATQRRRLRR